MGETCSYAFHRQSNKPYLYSTELLPGRDLQLTLSYLNYLRSMRYGKYIYIYIHRHIPALQLGTMAYKHVVNLLHVPASHGHLQRDIQQRKYNNT